MTAPALVRRDVAGRKTAPVAPRHGWRQDLIGWSFAAPFVVLFGVFLALPILAALAMSFTSFGLRDLENPIGTTVVGVQNYADLLADAKFWKSLGNTAYFVVVGVPLTLALGLVIANALSRGITRFRTAFRVGYYLPVITSIVAIAVVWRFLLNPDVGLINLCSRRSASAARTGSPIRRSPCHRSSRWPSGEISDSPWSYSSPECRRSPRCSMRPHRSTGPGVGNPFAS